VGRRCSGRHDQSLASLATTAPEAGCVRNGPGTTL
jgi:hypothetical protein